MRSPKTCYRCGALTTAGERLSIMLSRWDERLPELFTCHQPPRVPAPSRGHSIACIETGIAMGLCSTIFDFVETQGDRHGQRHQWPGSAPRGSKNRDSRAARQQRVADEDRSA